MQISSLHNIFLNSNGITTDSRHCTKGSIFFALKGENFNGNSFAIEALNRGCSYAVIDEKDLYDAADARLILVENTLTALQELAQYHRMHSNCVVIGITGTNGKTTTKELIAAVMGSRFRTLYTEGNLNNAIGVPITLLRLKPEEQFAIVEMGASHPGDIDELVHIAMPDYGIITNVGMAHLQGFGSFDGVVRTKGELYNFLREKEGKIFLNMGNTHLCSIATGIESIPYGIDCRDGVEGCVVECNPYLKIKWSYKGGEEHTCQTHLIGAYNLENILAAIAIGRYFGVEEKLINSAIEGYLPKNNRSQLIPTEHNQLVVDAYNANPTSMRAAIENFAFMKADNKVLLLGDMLELGDYSIEEHCAIIQLLQREKFQQIHLIGRLFANSYAIVGESGDSRFRLYESTAQLKKQIEDGVICFRDCTILIKGSNSIGLPSIIPML